MHIDTYIDIYIKMCGIERYSSAYNTVPDYNFADCYADDRYSDHHAHEPEQRSSGIRRAIGSRACAVRSVECR
jgi:hypothetical protein